MYFYFVFCNTDIVIFDRTGKYVDFQVEKIICESSRLYSDLVNTTSSPRGHNRKTY